MDRLSNNLSQVNINGIVLQTGSSSTPPSAPVSIADIISSDGFSETAYNEFDAKTLSNLWSVSKKLRGELSYFYKHILNEKYKRGIADINPNLEFYSTFKACCIRNPQEKALEIKQRYDQFVLESKQRGLFKILNDLKGRDNFQAVCALLKKESQYVLKLDIEKWERAQREPS